ncbi:MULTISPECIES: MarR family winged helix-turn-helix transcriptional regulator [unclassified Bacillus (in: firmicutes)]|uniref:MarR family winged helix-turn-helix transcriptional regulator n=1 Tax=unclassified Bacillus (in: firmicutes) TaxID=185979 RepID=UPI0003FADA9D|nr:MarR family transcriptional regulator [Bacillus sp. NSP9.1]QHZ47197.1 MarR family transcriptional regulator [Bacillus sp. NSP9.1]
MSRTNQKGRETLIEELIQQLRFHSTATVFMHQAIGEKIGLNATDHKCLEILARKGSMTAGELAEKSSLTTGAITGVIDRLENAGYARRTRDASDRRRLLIELVPENMENIYSLFEELAQQSAVLFSRYTDQELQVITRFIKHSTEFAANYVEKIRGAQK